MLCGAASWGRGAGAMDPLAPDEPPARSASLLQQLRNRNIALRARLEALHQARLEAAERLGSLTRRQLHEIKQLARAPPEIIRRTLAAAWLILHAAKFRGKPAEAVRFDDVRDWPRCQRMLGEERFVGRIMDLDPVDLAAAPQVLQHVATNYFGLGEPAEALALRKTSQGSLCSRASTRSSFSRSRRSESKYSQPLELAAVTRASEPCGALLQWMQSLLNEVEQRSSIEAELDPAADLEALEIVEVSPVPPTPLKPPLSARLLLEPLTEKPKSPLPTPARSPPCSGRRQGVLLKPLPAPQPAAAKAVEVELHVTGQLAPLRQRLSRLRLSFGRKKAILPEAEEAEALLRPIAEILQQHRGRLKLRLVGHCEHGEDPGLDLARSQAVAAWLTEEAAVPKGLLRVEARALGDGCAGRCVVAIPVQELVPLYGPISAELAAARAPVGIYFEARSAAIAIEAHPILKEMAHWLQREKSAAVIEGHGDHFEPAEITQQRANEVLKALVGFGVDPKQLRTVACGPVYWLSRRQAALNRRVELHLDCEF